MTECRNCNLGMVDDDDDGEAISLGEWTTCQCCHGQYENCPNCEREFPNSIVAVQMGND